ncbi:MAG: hypothetical protein ACI9QA_000839 [Methanobacteriota archaeon]|uniref:Uncharacterized protein n=1 Tax=Halorutilus salinus TaxID=2487751 RepID=A0A9Q4C4R1_9EURY|nr:hypothetical protein [Halorutilus salinus]MCX2819032.1 hypothetical protein [Halorutilus salinus]
MLRDESDGRTEKALNAFAVVLSLSLFARGFGSHLGFAVFMAVVVPVLLRLTLGLLVYEYRHETWVESLDGRADG